MGKFLEWLISPFVEDLYVEAQEEITEKTISEIKHTKNTFLYRPKTFSEYIGQKKAKEILKNYLIGCNKRKIVFPHTLIQGTPGSGKTTLANILINYIGGNYITKIGSELKKDINFQQLINSVPYGSLYIDEIHALDRDLVEQLYPIMEDFLQINPFTLIGSTTELGEIIKDREPFVDRFKILIELEKYTLDELVYIAIQYKEKLFPKETFPNHIYLILAQNCRNSPRFLLRLLEATVYFEGNINKVLKAFDILKNGLTRKDLKVLQYIAESSVGVGLNSIANYIGTSQENYLYSIEPFLLQYGYIIRTAKGRKITIMGLQLIQTLLSII